MGRRKPLSRNQPAGDAGAQAGLHFFVFGALPFKEKHIAELQAIVPSAKIILVDGEMFSWYGSRLQWAGPYLQDLLGIMQQYQ